MSPGLGPYFSALYTGTERTEGSRGDSHLQRKELPGALLRLKQLQ